MFSVHCSIHDRSELLSPSALLSVHATDRGRLAWYRCACGRVGWLIEGADVAPSLRAGRCA